MTTALPYTIALEYGDTSGDGHSYRDTYIIYSNIEPKELKEAYKLGSKKLGFDLIKEYCTDYQDNYVPGHIIKAIDPNEMNDPDSEGDSFSIYGDQWPELYLSVCKHGNPDFKYVKGSNPTIGIGGYGLFQ